MHDNGKPWRSLEDKDAAVEDKVHKRRHGSIMVEHLLDAETIEALRQDIPQAGVVPIRPRIFATTRLRGPEAMSSG